MDFGFKKIFGDKEIMINFLNSVIQPDSLITDIKFIDKELEPDNKEFACIIYDLFCTTADNRTFIVEMQKREQEFFADRIIYYMSKSITSQHKRGDQVYTLQPVYGIFIMDFHLKDHARQRKRVIKLTTEGSNEEFSNKIKIFTLELPEYRNMREEECTTPLDQWLYNLANMEDMTTAIPFQQQNEIFRKMQELSEFINMSSEDQDTYERELDKYITYIDSINFAKKEGIEKGKKEGIEIGIEKGKKEGIEIGIEKGKKEGIEEGKKEGIEIGIEKERLKTAKAMKAQGIAIEIIITCTNLSKEEIEKL